jgi:hypothetical protein
MTAMRQFTAETRAGVAGLPPLLRMPLLGAVICGLLGGLCGLVVGLNAYPPTAWFAVLEVGVPGALLGAVAGLVAGAVSGRGR